jgi:uncharacterized protein YjbJ (UPF0337 family)
LDVDEERPFVTAISEPEDHGETGGIAKDSADLTRWLLRKIGRAAGAITGDEDLKAEGRPHQRKAAAEQEAAQKERTRRAEAEQAERQRNKQELKDKGLLGNVGDTLPNL